MTDVLLGGLLIQGCILIYIGAIACGWLDEIHSRLAPDDDDGPAPEYPPHPMLDKSDYDPRGRCPRGPGCEPHQTCDHPPCPGLGRGKPRPILDPELDDIA
jgi:hypothetical protein